MNMAVLLKLLYFGGLIVAGIGGVFAAVRLVASREGLRKPEFAFLALGVVLLASIGVFGQAEWEFKLIFLVSALSAFLLVLRSLLGERVRKVSLAAAGVAVLVMTIYEIYLWQTLGRPPFQFLSETFLWMALLSAALLVVSEGLQGLKGLGQFTGILLLAFLDFGLVWPDLRTKELPPALQSAWFVPHVLVYLLGYGALTLAFITAVGYLIAERFNLKFAAALGDSSYKLVSLGFPFLTAGLAFGAFWGQTAWGSYWAWDPKENWALVTWLVYLIYLHLRYMGKWNRRRAAYFLILGVIVIFITYLAVSYLPTAQQSVHTYT